MLVFEEIPGWQHIGDDDWKGLALRDVRAMIERDHNHPSIIIWGVRINESWDDHDFYTQTNALARQLDPTRPTGGVRFFLNSEFLEDVFTYNDFSRSMGGVSGAIGWCAFDYNTHKEFGAGDRICYHGVSDIFRLHKYAAYAYASQTPPSVRPVLHVACNWKAGDYDEGQTIQPVTVLTNCDYIEAYVGDKLQGKFEPDRATYPSLPHPPIMMSNLDIRLAAPWGDLHVIGYVDGKPVAEQRIAADGVPARLELSVDDAELYADGADMTRVVFKIVDRYGNPLTYAVGVVTLDVEGPADLLGETVFPLVGGQAAVYLRSRHEAGTVVVRASTPRLAPAHVSVSLI